jgi:hypothetical protein
MVLEVFIVSACIVDGGDLEITRAGDSNGFLFYFIIFFSAVLRPNAGHGHLILEVSRSHSTTRHSLGRTPLDE